jgi:hypothetical protein
MEMVDDPDARKYERNSALIEDARCIGTKPAGLKTSRPALQVFAPRIASALPRADRGPELTDRFTLC